MKLSACDHSIYIEADILVHYFEISVPTSQGSSWLWYTVYHIPKLNNSLSGPYSVGIVLIVSVIGRLLLRLGTRLWAGFSQHSIFCQYLNIYFYMSAMYVRICRFQYICLPWENFKSRLWSFMTYLMGIFNDDIGLNFR